MKSESECNKKTNKIQSEVGTHYLIKNKWGNNYLMVPDLIHCLACSGHLNGKIINPIK